MKFLNELVEASGNEMASLVENGVAAGDVESYIDTGSFIFNALLCGDLFGGAASNKVTAFAGETGVGKTFFLLGIIKSFLEKNPTAGVIYFESESALTKDMIASRGIDIKRMVIIPVTTVQEFRHQALKVLDKYCEKPEGERPKLVMCLDSLGNLSTTKEIEDSASGKETQDMTRARLVKGVFRVLTLKLAKAKVPLFVTNHTYLQVGTMYPQQIMGGGSGLQYAASTIVFLSKRKEKDGDEVVGNIIHCKNIKNRLAKENKMVDVLLTYDKGLNRYYGLSDLAISAGIFKKPTTRIELPDGTKVFEKALNNNPEKYYTEEILNKLNEVVKQMFLYGTSFIGEQENGEAEAEEDSKD
jgi:RecA/RadA recombinase